MTAIHPPGPFPPRHAPPDQGIDLAVRLRDERFTRAWIEDEVRPALARGLREAGADGDLDALADALEAFLATWPVAARIDTARQAWGARGDGRSVAVLARAAPLVRRAAGWDAQAGTPWPMPDAPWIRDQADEGPWQVHRRDRLDGAEAVATVLDAPMAGEPTLPDTCLDLPADQLVARRPELGHRLATGALRAVRLRGAVPATPAAQLAHGELRLEGAAQEAVEAFGLAALDVDDVPAFDDLLSPAPAGDDGAVLRTRCARALVPGTPRSLREQITRPVCYLLWDGPHPPVAVDPVVAPALEVAEGGAGRDEVLDAVDGRDDVLRELLAVGALGARSSIG